MTTIIKEETGMESVTKTYLQMYEEFITGYKQYKKERAEAKITVQEEQAQ